VTDLPFPTVPLAVPNDRQVARAVARAEAGKNLDLGEVEALLAARGEPLIALQAVARRVRDAGLVAAGRPGVTTYSRKVFVPLTRLCRDRCHYCTFAAAPGRLDALYLPPDEVLAIAREGARLGCKEALFTLGDRPEDRWPQARQWLEEAGYASTLEYVRAMAILVLEETGLLPHLNPGVMSWAELNRLKPVAPSMGMMLETTSERLYLDKDGPHHGSPDKDQAGCRHPPGSGGSPRDRCGWPHPPGPPRCNAAPTPHLSSGNPIGALAPERLP
jgi:FO synthase